MQRFTVFESSVNSYDSQTHLTQVAGRISFESSVNSYDSQTITDVNSVDEMFESSVNSYDSQTWLSPATMVLRV